MFYLCAARGVVVDELNISLGGELTNNKSVSDGESARSVVIRSKTDIGCTKIDSRQSNVYSTTFFKKPISIAGKHSKPTRADDGLLLPPSTLAAVAPRPYLSAANPVCGVHRIRNFFENAFLRSLTERAKERQI